MRTYLGKLIIALMGWKLKGEIPSNIKNYVLIAAPHTSNMDFFIALPAMWGYNIHGKYLIKQELFWWPLSLWLKFTGGIPVDRKNSNSEFLKKLKMHLTEGENVCLLFTPEGTRSYTEKWKTGFHRVAKSLNLPIVLAYADYAKKEVMVGEVIYPTDNLENDLLSLETYFRNVNAKHPEKFNKQFFVR